MMGDYCPPASSFRNLGLVNSNGGVKRPDGEIVGILSGTDYYRIFTALSEVKYLAFQRDGSEADWDGEKVKFDTVPDGDWNVGNLTIDEDSGGYILNSVETKLFETVKTRWRPCIDERDLGKQFSASRELQSYGKLSPVICNNYFGFDKVMVHVECHPKYTPGTIHETEAYRLLDEHNILPRFLAHITENHDRVIGYMTEHVSSRCPTIEDLEACRKVLSKLHNLGFLHGWRIPHGICSFLVCDDGRVLLQNMGHMKKTDDKGLLAKEMASLEDMLKAKINPFPILEDEEEDEDEVYVPGLWNPSAASLLTVSQV